MTGTSNEWFKRWLHTIYGEGANYLIEYCRMADNEPDTVGGGTEFYFAANSRDCDHVNFGVVELLGATIGESIKTKLTFRQVRDLHAALDRVFGKRLADTREGVQPYPSPTEAGWKWEMAEGTLSFSRRPQPKRND